MLYYICYGGLQNGSPFGGLWREVWERGEVKEGFLAAEIPGSVFSVVPYTCLQRWAARLFLSMRCRADSHARGILVHAILQIEMRRLLWRSLFGFFPYTSSEPVELIKVSTVLRHISLCGSIRSLVVAGVPFPHGRAGITVEFSLLPIGRNSSGPELYFACFSSCCPLPPHRLSPCRAVCHVISIVLTLTWQFVPIRSVV